MVKISNIDLQYDPATLLTGVLCYGCGYQMSLQKAQVFKVGYSADGATEK